ncbi:unnamed protein product [Candidula unifasciata]|uniref:Uncharacterized protein n=1 Tax=Candidula unifasciata TaxID=100452 RepID=A0A8S4A5T4_9EUPU|nr:unnamed protein product [Candidula unifasciata]
MASPLLILFSTSVIAGFLATLLLVVAVSVDNWEHTSYDLHLLRSVNASCRTQAHIECQVTQISDDPLMIRFDEFGNNNSRNYSSLLLSTHGGLWRVCHDLTDKLISEHISAGGSNYNGQRCYTYVTDYDEESEQLTKETKQIARLQNSAASCFIVVLMDLCSAAVVGILGLIHKQVASCMIAGVLYLTAGRFFKSLFGVFGLSMFHTKDYYEKYKCYAIDEIPSKVCSSRTVTVGYAVPLAWAGIVMCILACFIWLFVSKVLRVLRAKTML